MPTNCFFPSWVFSFRPVSKAELSAHGVVLGKVTESRMHNLVRNGFLPRGGDPHLKQDRPYLVRKVDFF